jgi:hypothetical protein
VLNATHAHRETQQQDWRQAHWCTYIMLFADTVVLAAPCSLYSSDNACDG